MRDIEIHVDHVSLYDLYSKGISNLAVKRV
jgi:hypothetical protein